MRRPRPPIPAPLPDAAQVRDALRRAATETELKPSPVRDLARQLIQEATREEEERIANARAEIHDVIATLNLLAARVERLRMSSRQTVLDCDIPQGIPKWNPGDTLNLPIEFGGEFFETNKEAFFWEGLDLQGVREALASQAATLARDLGNADPYHAVRSAEELLRRLPAEMLDAIRARLAELKT